MQVRQVYTDNESRTTAFAGSVGTLEDEYVLKLSFNALINGTEPTSKSIVFELYYDASTNSYVSDDASAMFDGNVIWLTHEFDGTSHITVYNVHGNKITRLMPSISPAIVIDGVTYVASDEGIFADLRHSKFIDKNAELSTKANCATYAKDAEAVRQYLLQHLAVMKHELWYNYEYGLPILQTGVTKAMIDAEVAMIISECPHVEHIEEFESHIDDNHQYHLTFSIMTSYGKLELIDTL